jgi:hypothetical protein
MSNKNYYTANSLISVPTDLDENSMAAVIQDNKNDEKEQCYEAFKRIFKTNRQVTESGEILVDFNQIHEAFLNHTTPDGQAYLSYHDDLDRILNALLNKQGKERGLSDDDFARVVRKHLYDNKDEDNLEDIYRALTGNAEDKEGLDFKDLIELRNYLSVKEDPNPDDEEDNLLYSDEELRNMFIAGSSDGETISFEDIRKLFTTERF